MFTWPMTDFKVEQTSLEVHGCPASHDEGKEPF
jgi:hypothetical protein